MKPIHKTVVLMMFSAACAFGVVGILDVSDAVCVPLLTCPPSCASGSCGGNNMCSNLCGANCEIHTSKECDIACGGTTCAITCYEYWHDCGCLDPSSQSCDCKSPESPLEP